MAISSLVTPARRARGWLMLTRIFLERIPQSSLIFLGPGMVRNFSLTLSTIAKTLVVSRPEIRTSIGFFTGGPSCKGLTCAFRSGKLSKQNFSSLGTSESIISREVAFIMIMLYSGLACSGLYANMKRGPPSPMNGAQLVTPSSRSGPTIRFSRMKSSICITTSSVRSIGVPVGSLNLAVNVGRSLGGKKTFGTKRKHIKAVTNIRSVTATDCHGRFRIAIMVFR